MKQTGHALTGIKRRIEKLLRTAKDTRGNSHVTKGAQATAERLMKKWGLKMEDMDLSGHPEFPGKNVEFHWVRGKRKIPFSTRILSVIVSDIFHDVEILATTFISKNVRLSFACIKPKSPQRALELFLRLEEELTVKWKAHDDYCRKLNSQPTLRIMITGSMNRIKRSSERSFYGGILNGMKDRLPVERAAIKRIEDKEQRAAEIRALLEAPEPWIPPPHNPLALMVINRKPVVAPESSKDEEQINQIIATIESEDKPSDEPPAYEEPEDSESDEESQFSYTEGYAVGMNTQLIRPTNK